MQRFSLRKGGIMDRVVIFLNTGCRSIRLTWLLIGIMVLLYFVSPSHAADPGRQARLQHEVAEAQANCIRFCTSREVWRYDNLRPTVLRTIAPVIPPARMEDMPVVHLSPGSPDYRRTVGQMMYLCWYLASRRQRLAEFLAEKENEAPPAGWALPQIHNDYEEDFDDDAHHAEGELDQAHAGYGRACAWAWPYINLRPLCKYTGFEAAAILNPIIPVPKVRLSEASPDYKETVTALNYWEPKIGNAKVRLQDLSEDRKAAVAAAKALAAAGLKIKPPDANTPPEDHRMAEMFKIYEQIKPALRRWRKDEHKVEALAEPFFIAKNTLASLQFQAQEIQRRIALLQLKARNPKEDHFRIQAEIQTYQNQLTVLTPQIAKARQELSAIENQVRELRADLAQLAGQTDALMEAWVHHSDLLGRLGPSAHDKTLPLLNQWIAEEPRLWQLYFARGVARLHAAQYKEAIEDLNRVEGKLRLYDPRPAPLALVMAVQAHTLCKQDDPRQKHLGDRRFTDAKKLAPRSWAVCLIRGWSNLEREKYPTAKSDFQMALQLSKKTPQAEPIEAMALLLAACPADRYRNGAKAVEHATKACDLTKNQDWLCLDTLAAAHAEVGDFDAAAPMGKPSVGLRPGGKPRANPSTHSLIRKEKAVSLEVIIAGSKPPRQDHFYNFRGVLIDNGFRIPFDWGFESCNSERSNACIQAYSEPADRLANVSRSRRRFTLVATCSTDCCDMNH